MSSGTRIRVLVAVASVLVLGLLTAVPLAIHFLRERRGRRDASTLDR